MSHSGQIVYILQSYKMSNMLRAPRASSQALRSAFPPPGSHLYIGCSSPELPPGKLPSEKDVLQLITWYREQPKAAKKGIPQFCCSSKARSKESECLQEGGCVEKGSPCLAFKVKRPYLMAGLVTVSDQAIERHLKSVNEDYLSVVKLKDKSTPGAESRKAEYQEKILTTFNIVDPNARKIIENDQNRSTAAKKEDLRFFDDYFGSKATRRMAFAGRDKAYDAAVEKCNERGRKRRERQEQEERRVQREEDRRMEENQVQAWKYSNFGFKTP